PCCVSPNVPKQDAVVVRLAALFGAIRWQRHTNSTTTRTSISAGLKRLRPSVSAQSFCRWQPLGLKSLNNGKREARERSSRYRPEAAAQVAKRPGYLFGRFAQVRSYNVSAAL